MNVNPAEVSSAIVAILTPFMPYLVNAAQFSASAIGEMVVQNGGEAAWQRAQILWGKIVNHHKDDAVINGAATMLAAQPENERFQSSLAHELAMRLQDEQALLNEIIAVIGGQESVQKILANNSLVEDITQKAQGKGGTQIVKAENDSVIKGVEQNIKR